MGKYPYFPSVETTWKKKQKFTDLEITEKTTPSNPASGFLKLYFKADGKLYKLNSSGVESTTGADDLSAYATLASPTFTGTVTTALLDVAGNNIDNIQNLVHDTSTTTTALDFALDQLQTISISANTTFTTVNRAIGKSKTIKITTDGTLRTLTFPLWKFIGAKPADQVASKIGILTLTCFGTADTDIVSAYAVEE